VQGFLVKAVVQDKIKKRLWHFFEAAFQVHGSFGEWAGLCRVKITPSLFILPPNMRVNVLYLLLVLALACTSCAGTHKHKKLKPGKPIPCPVKDC